MTNINPPDDSELLEYRESDSDDTGNGDRGDRNTFAPPVGTEEAPDATLLDGPVDADELQADEPIALDGDDDGLDASSEDDDAVDASDNVAEDEPDDSDGVAVADPLEEDLDDPLFGADWSEPDAQQLATRASAAATATRDWSTRWDVAEDPYVVGVTDALVQRTNLAMWANLDPVELLPEPEPAEGRLLDRTAYILTVIRNVAVFVPVGLTWLSIYFVTNGFTRYREDLRAAGGIDDGIGEDRGRNFLEFWQSGIDPVTQERYFGSFWQIQEVAWKVAAIIALIVALTVVASLLQSQSRRRAARATVRADRERLQVALAIAAALSGNRRADPASITEALAVALDNLSAAARDVNTAAERFEVVSVGMQGLSPQIDALSQHVASLSGRIDQGMSESIERLSASVETLGVTLGGDMEQFLANIIEGLDVTGERLNKMSVAMEFGTKQLRDDLEAMHQQLGRLVR